MTGISLEQLESTQRFELELAGDRRVVTPSEIGAALSNGTASISSRVWIGGYEGLLKDLDKRTIGGVDYFFLRGTELELMVMSAKASPVKAAPRDSAQSPLDLDDPFADVVNIDLKKDSAVAYQPGGASTKTIVAIAIAGAVAVALLVAVVLIFVLKSGKEQEPDSAEQPVAEVENAAPGDDASKPEEDAENDEDLFDFENESAKDDEKADAEKADEDEPDDSDETAASDEDETDGETIDDEENPFKFRPAEDADEPEGTDDSDEYDDLTDEGLDPGAENARKSTLAPESPADVVPLPFATTPFKPEGGRVAVGYRGHDLAALDSAIYKAIKPDEQTIVKPEDVERVRDRKIRALRKSGVLGEIKLDSYVAICLPPRSVAENALANEVSNFVDEFYDAGAKTLTIVTELGADDITFLSGTGVDGVRYGGAYQRVADEEGMETGFVFQLPSAPSKKTGKAQSVPSVKGYYRGAHYATSKDEASTAPFVERWRISEVDSDFVKDHAGRLAVCCVGKLTVLDPAIEGLFGHIGAKNELVDKIGVEIKEAEFWVYDYLTGAVFAKYTASEVRRGVIKRLNDLTSGSKDVLAGEKDLNKDWDTVFAESKDVVEKWEIQPAAIAVPEDAPTLLEALDHVSEGDTIMIKAGEPVPLGEVKKTKGTDKDVVRIDKKVYIVGETGNPDDATILLDAKEYIQVGADVGIKGVTFRRDFGDSGPLVEPFIKVPSGKASFKFCIFDGGGRKDSLGVDVNGGKADFWKCSFTQFDKAGALVEEEGKAAFTYCEIGEENANGLVVLYKSRIDVSRTLFSRNGRAFVAQQGGGGKIEECFLYGNAHPYAISNASIREVERFDNILK